jgi:CheY-like chemotaxis protein
MDGYKVLEQLKGSKIKIIPVTASVLDEDRLRCENLGINEFLKKPISMKELQMALLL